MASDNGTDVGRSMINVRSSTFKALDRFRKEIEPGAKESWDTFFRRVLESRKLD